MRAPLILIALTAVAGGTLRAATVNPPTPPVSTTPVSDPAGVEFFEKRIRPVLSAQCFKCHASTSEKVKGGLLLDTRQGAIEGGETGPAIVPGHPEKSLLIEAIKYSNDDMKMPPKMQLPANVIADLTKWVQMGAPWPVDTNAVVVAKPAGGVPNYTANYDRLRKEHWAWQPIKEQPVPAVRNASWPHNEIDHFVLAKLDEKGIAPVADADRQTLIRRVSFDLTGLPPTPEEVTSFVNDTSPDAYAKLVDRLLGSRAFGERWGRHWLDVARYGESTGSARNVPYHTAWRYRDYVIDSFNKDKPYNRFISEQIAGDLMTGKTAQEHNEQLIATGFLAMGVKDLNERDRIKFEMDNVDEQIDVTTRSIMGLTVACARCHDHKFDPIPTVDYYALAGIFRSTQILAGVAGRNKGKKKEYGAPDLLYHLDGLPAPTPVSYSSSESAGEIRKLQAKADQLRAQIQKLRSGGNGNQQQRKSVRQELTNVESQIDGLRNPTAAANTASAGGAAMGVREGNPSDTAVCMHGEPHDLGQEVPRGFVSLVPVHNVGGVDSGHSGRLQLAEWLTSDQNPLTPRVMVNRIWEHLFGEGIVRTVDNFGSTGEAPADPELLDYLAMQFMKEGWSVKHIIREVVLSHAYQLSGATNPTNFTADPGVRLCWRMTSRRLDAEEIRDSMLAASGQLDRNPVQGSVAASLPMKELRDAHLGEEASSGTYRSVYLPIVRDLVPPVLDLFDFAEPTMVIGARDTTTVATQALYLMNDPFVISQAHNMATRVQNGKVADDGARVELAYHLALSRAPTPAEKSRAIRYVTDFSRDASFTAKETLKNARTDAWASFCQALFGSAEFRYLN